MVNPTRKKAQLTGSSTALTDALSRQTKTWEGGQRVDRRELSDLHDQSTTDAAHVDADTHSSGIGCRGNQLWLD